jgi:hypothetical protein
MYIVTLRQGACDFGFWGTIESTKESYAKDEALAVIRKLRPDNESVKRLTVDDLLVEQGGEITVH